mmetsp:Transcript_824/g.1971  ORF Transcript_824/g.1971 Transcript_824/m.1971 type:complete len:929 (-) Transcript_824:165-2951(-)|eukprot:CAMPEP_0172456872 /NCGR_PEP_ID=MMETSP1065-20121228/18270_1 /TAXON_ID=265537 /ORGANISM="Amphiprora paludosa, Strain CCMP125" /LENGTH=928 /DNA_ID=CAMNT_0013210171 /DNA_START=218 /DNA_END=3004 /DNA_ORIENTATION=-
MADDSKMSTRFLTGILLAVCLLNTGHAFSSSNLRSTIPSTTQKNIARSFHRHQGLSFDTQNFPTTKLFAATELSSDASDECRTGLFRQPRKNLKTRISGLGRRMARWMRTLTQWQKTNRFRSLLAAAVLSFSMISVSENTINKHIETTSNGASYTVPVERVQPNLNKRHEEFLRTARGGSATDRDHDFSFLRPKKGSKLYKMEHAVEDKLVKMEDGILNAGQVTTRTLKEALLDLATYMRGPKSDALIVLLATALITPLCGMAGVSPILGFLASGMFLGPNGFGVIRGIHTTEVFAELGIVFFLFEMGIELSIERLMSMRKDVFGLGLGQFLVTAAAVAGVGGLVGLPANAQVVIGGGLALSSSAFVLQLLKDKNQLATRFGKASFGILLFQDLAVVPLLVVTPILAGSGSGLTAAVGSALLKAGLALGSIAVMGRYILGGLFRTVAASKSQEAFLGLVLLTVLSMSFMTEGLGLSNTLGAFLAGVLLSDTKYRYQVEADIAPFRGILLGLFFLTVGYEIDLRLIFSRLPVVASLVAGLIGLKAAITTALSLAFGLSLPTSLQTGLILSQGGEFAFVAFGLARSLGILDSPTTKLLLTSASLSMALTPFLASAGGKLAKRLEEGSDFTHYLGQDTDATEIKNSDDFAVVVGYGQVGKVVCNLLDRKLFKYVGLELDPNKAIQARNSGLPVFYGDIGRQEVAEAFNVGKAKIVIVCISERELATRVVIALRRWYPDLKIFCRAVDADHQSRLQNTLNVAAMVPVLPEDTIMMTLPFGAAVMRTLGVPADEVAAIIEGKKREVMMSRSTIVMEEEAMLAQLGIPRTDEDEEDPAVREQLMDKAAGQRRLEALEKSPFVAEVIEDACPESVCVEDDEAESIVDAEILPEEQMDQLESTLSEEVTGETPEEVTEGTSAVDGLNVEDETGAFQ